MKISSIIGLILFLLLFVGYPVALWWNIKKVDNFCIEMKPGLEVIKIADIANRYNVGFKNIRDPQSVALGKLGIKTGDQEWVFYVPASMTMGEHACGVYHNNKVVLSAKVSG
jgi:hypothetical protein